VAGSCEYFNGALTSVKDEKFLDRLSNCQLSKENTAAWS
jgi:hypothetical protein